MHIACAHCGTVNRVPEPRLAEAPQCGRCGRELLPGAPLEVSDSVFPGLIARTELPVLVDFWAAWCGPCRMMAPQFAQAAAQWQGRVLFAKVDSDASPQAASRYGIRSIPTLLLFHGGREIARQSGALQAAQIDGWLRQALRQTA